MTRARPCQCARPIVDGEDCIRCGRTARTPTPTTRRIGDALVRIATGHQRAGTQRGGQHDRPTTT